MQFDDNVSFRLSFGRNIGTSGKVTDSEVSSFLSDVVSKHFQGFSVSFGLGYWNGKPEESVYLDILSEDTASTRNGLATIATEYNTRFNQDCVLVTRTVLGAAFHSLRLSEVKTA